MNGQSKSDKIKVGLYGNNGHQIHDKLTKHPLAEIHSVCQFPTNTLPAGQKIKIYPSLEQMIADPELNIVSLCSSRRATQAQDAIKCLKAGKHVYAEKPCALSVPELEEILATANENGCKFHEMAGTAFLQPYCEMRKIVMSGKIGKVVQVFVQKSYPYCEWRPQNPDIDGGLFLQVGIHAARLIEHVGGVKIKDISYCSTRLGNPVEDGTLEMATAAHAKLENGGVASFICNYLNPMAFGQWENEELRIFGTEGFVESVDSGARTRLALNDNDMGSLNFSKEDQLDYFNCFLENLVFDRPMPLSIEDELHPLIALLKAEMRG